MKRIPIEKAQADIILAQKLEGHDGVLLAKKGAEITDGSDQDAGLYER